MPASIGNRRNLSQGPAMSHSFEIHGHRGARGLLPENTIDSFRRALELGVDALELDVGMTADGVVVVTHDPALNPDITRGPDGAWLPERGPLVRDLRASDLAAFDVGRIRPGSAYAARLPQQQARDGARIPALASVLRLDATVRFAIELKTIAPHPDWTVDAATMADAVLTAIDGAGAGELALVEAFDWRGPRRVRQVRPGTPVACLTNADTVAKAGIWWGGPHPSDFAGSVPRAVAAEGAATWGPDYVDLTEALVAEAHALGLR